jgi:uncharacterized protein (TIGR03083 family)
VPIDYVASVSADAENLAAVLSETRLDTPVPTCPEWTLRDLGHHLGRVHRWVAEIVRTGARPDGYDPGQAGDDVAAWVRAGSDGLTEALRSRDPAEPCWTFAAPAVVGFWSRRQAIETAVHRWDGENAAGSAHPIDAEVGSDGVDEMLTVMAPMSWARKAPDVAGTIHLHCTDVDGEWLVRLDGKGAFDVTREHAKGDVAFRGPASSLLLALWRRLPAGAEGLEVLGDADLLTRFLAEACPA